jgi:DNA-binding phage protein
MLHPNDIPKMELALVERGLTVAQLCDKAGIAKTTWWRWSERRASPTFATWEAVVATFNEMTGGEPVQSSSEAKVA